MSGNLDSCQSRAANDRQSEAMVMAKATQPTSGSQGASTLPAVLQSGALAALDEQAKALILKQMIPLHLNAGERAFRPGFACCDCSSIAAPANKITAITTTKRFIVPPFVKAHNGQVGRTPIPACACSLVGMGASRNGRPWPPKVPSGKRYL